MTSHPWLPPSAALVAKTSRALATAVLRELPKVPAKWLGARAPAWSPLFASLAGLLRADSSAVVDAVTRVDVLSVLQELRVSPVEEARLERALVTLWLGLAGHPGLAKPLALPGPFRQPVIDPRAPRIILLAGTRGLIATKDGPVVLGQGGRQPLERFAVADLPAFGDTVLTSDGFAPPPAEVTKRIQEALASVAASLPGGRLERVRIGAGAAAYGEACVAPDGTAADLLASAQTAFVKAASAIDPPMRRGGNIVGNGRRLAPAEALAEICGATHALPWRADAAGAGAAIARDLDDLDLVAEPTESGSPLMAAIRASIGSAAPATRRVLLLNTDADDFVYSFQFGRSVERRCVERGVRLDRIAIDTRSAQLDLAAELGQPIPDPIVDGTEILLASENDPALDSILRRLSTREYQFVVGNIRARLFYDLLELGMLRIPTLLWDRHLHGGLQDERARRGLVPEQLRGLPLRAWSLANKTGEGLQPSLREAGFENGKGRPWPMDLDFFRSTATPIPGRLFAGGDNGRDWPLLVEAVRGLPLDVHLVTRQAPPDLPPNVHVEARLPLWRFRDAIAEASIMALPLIAGLASGITVLPMAMAMGVPVVATRTNWTEQYAIDGEEALLVPPGDAAAFRAAIVRLHEEPDLRRRLIENARKKVAALCDLDAFTAEMLAAAEAEGC